MFFFMLALKNSIELVLEIVMAISFISAGTSLSDRSTIPSFSSSLTSSATYYY
jgi:uncharacterized membrane protein YphA (DoxX/SURF4 family)